MCFNFSLTKKQAELEKKFSHVLFEAEFQAWYTANAFTQPMLPVITNQKKTLCQLFQWGLIPFWVKDPATASKIRQGTYNARAETIFQKPAFKNSILNKRCLIPADGFFEWRENNGSKYPYYIYLSEQKLFCFAGIWDCWLDPVKSTQVNTFSIITTQANSFMAKIHNQKKRMPVILAPGDEHRWLDRSLTRQQISQLLKPREEIDFQAHPVSKMITGRQGNSNHPHILKPCHYPELV